jgi:RNA polymerase sigma-70 factor (ECF subfamily)
MMQRESSRSDQELLAATYAGDAPAFGEFFARHSRSVLGYIRRRVGNAELAADLTAETFAAALVAVHRGRASEVPEGAAWLRGIARHKIIDSYRQGKLEDEARRQLGMERLLPVAEDLESIDRLTTGDTPVHDALERLSLQDREAVIERVVQERGYTDIAREHHTSEATVRKRVSRGIARLRRVLEPN